METIDTGALQQRLEKEKGLPCRPLQVNREEAYGGAFKGKPAADSGGAGG